MEKLPKTIYLKKEFRINLFSKVYRSEESLRGIALVMGYEIKPGCNGKIRDMWLGKVGITSYRLINLIKFAKIPINKVMKNLVDKKDNEIIDDWYESYRNFINEKSLNRK